MDHIKNYISYSLAIHRANKRKFQLHGGGKSKRSFIYCDDFCNGIYKLITKQKLVNVINFPQEYLSIRKKLK